jgi:hypothetical protein
MHLESSVILLDFELKKRNRKINYLPRFSIISISNCSCRFVILELRDE